MPEQTPEANDVPRKSRIKRIVDSRTFWGVIASGVAVASLTPVLVSRLHSEERAAGKNIIIGASQQAQRENLADKILSQALTSSPEKFIEIWKKYCPLAAQLSGADLNCSSLNNAGNGVPSNSHHELAAPPPITTSTTLALSPSTTSLP